MRQTLKASPPGSWWRDGRGDIWRRNATGAEVVILDGRDGTTVTQWDEEDLAMAWRDFAPWESITGRGRK